MGAIESRAGIGSKRLQNGDKKTDENWFEDIETAFKPPCLEVYDGVRRGRFATGCRFEGWLQRAFAPNRLQNRHGVAATVAGRGTCNLAVERNMEAMYHVS